MPAKNHYILHVRIRTIAWKIGNVDVRQLMSENSFRGSAFAVVFLDILQVSEATFVTAHYDFAKNSNVMPTVDNFENKF